MIAVICCCIFNLSPIHSEACIVGIMCMLSMPP